MDEQCSDFITDAEIALEWTRDKFRRRRRDWKVTAITDTQLRKTLHPLPYVTVWQHSKIQNNSLDRADMVLNSMYPKLAGLLQLGLVAAGGAIVRSIWGGMMLGLCDIDLFFVGSDPAAATKLLYASIEFLIKGSEDSVRVVRNKHTVTVTILHPRGRVFQDYQFMLRLYPSIGHILGGFDIPAAAVAYTADGFVATDFGKWCCINRLIIVDTDRRSPSYEYRLYKYSRYCNIIFPAVKRQSIEARVTSMFRQYRAERDREMEAHGMVYDEDSTETVMPAADYAAHRHLLAYAAELGVDIVHIQLKLSTPVPDSLQDRVMEIWCKYGNNPDQYDSVMSFQLGYCKLEATENGTCNFVAMEAVSDYIEVSGLSSHINMGLIRRGRYEYVATSVLNPSSVAECFGAPVLDPIEVMTHYKKCSEKMHCEWDSHYNQKLFPWNPELMTIPEDQFADALAAAAASTASKIIKIAGEISVAYCAVEWITENPGRQWTASFNPIIADPRDWYGEFYSNPADVSPGYRTLVEAEYTLRLMRRRYPFNTLPRDIFNIIALDVLGLN